MSSKVSMRHEATLVNISPQPLDLPADLSPDEVWEKTREFVQTSLVLSYAYRHRRPIQTSKFVSLEEYTELAEAKVSELEQLLSTVCALDGTSGLDSLGIRSHIRVREGTRLHSLGMVAEIRLRAALAKAHQALLCLRALDAQAIAAEVELNRFLAEALPLPEFRAARNGTSRMTYKRSVELFLSFFKLESIRYINGCFGLSVAGNKEVLKAALQKHLEENDRRLEELIATFCPLSEYDDLDEELRRANMSDIDDDEELRRANLSDIDHDEELRGASMSDNDDDEELRRANMSDGD